MFILLSIYAYCGVNGNYGVVSRIIGGVKDYILVKGNITMHTICDYNTVKVK